MERSTAEAPCAGKRRKRWSSLPALLGGLALVAGISQLVWSRASTPVPPVVDLTGVDPAIAAAIEDARAAVGQAARSAPAWGRLGMVLLTHGFTAEAKTCLAQAEQLDPSEPRWSYHQAIALLEADPEAAIGKLQRAAVQCGDTVVAVRACLAEALLRQDRLREAELQFRQILHQQPSDPRALIGLSRLAYRCGKLHEGLAYAQRSLRAGGARKSSHLLLAEIYQRLGDQKAAEQQARQAALPGEEPPWPDPFLQELERLRTGERANLQRGQKLLDLGRVPQAVTLLQHMVQLYPDSAPCWLLLGRALVHQQSWQAAEQALQKGLQLAPDNPEIHVEMGVALYYQWNPRAAVHFRRAIEIQPDCAPAYYNLGLWLARIHDKAGALDAFQRAIRVQPNLADAYLGLGSQLSLQGKIAKAVPYLQQALQLNPKDRRARRLLRQALDQVAVPPFP